MSSCMSPCMSREEMWQGVSDTERDGLRRRDLSGPATVETLSSPTSGPSYPPATVNQQSLAKVAYSRRDMPPRVGLAQLWIPRESR